MMRKNFLRAALFVSVFLCMTACADKGKTKVRIATGGTTGTYYAYSGVVAQALNEQLDDVKVVVHSSGASKANIFEVVDKDADMAIVQNDVAYYAAQGTDLFELDGKTEGFSALGAVYSEAVQIISNSNIESIEDLRGKTVSVGDAGSGCEFNARQILEVYGMSFDDIKVQNLSFSDSAEALKDSKIDAFFCVAGAPTTAIVELATTNNIKALTIDDGKLEALKEKYPFYTKYVIKAGSYKGIDTDTETVAVKATYIVADRLSDDVVYEMTKTIYEHPEKIVHAKAAELDKEFAVSGISFDFHPGAKRYFEEVGVLK